MTWALVVPLSPNGGGPLRNLSFSNRRTWIVPLLLAAMLSLSGQAPRPEPVTDQETQLGDAAYKELKDKAEIIDKSPLYDALNPITTEIRSGRAAAL